MIQFLPTILSAGLQLYNTFKDDNQQSPVMGENDWIRHQSQLDRANPREIARESAFLEGVAPAQGNAYNIYQDIVSAPQARRNKEAMDIMYEGTTPWERLGTSPSPAVMSQAPQNKTAQTGASMLQAGAQLAATKQNNQTALKQTLIQSASQIFMAQMNNQNQQRVTEMQGENALATAAVQNLPKEEQNRLTERAQEYQRTLAYTQAERMQSQTQTERERTFIQLMEGFYKMMPETALDLGMLRTTFREASPDIQRAMLDGYARYRANGNLDGFQFNPQSFDEGDMRQAVEIFDEETLAILNLVGNTTKGALQTANNAGGFLQGILRMITGRNSRRQQQAFDF